MKTTLLIVALIFAVSACSDGGDGGIFADDGSLRASDGWDAFAAGDYEQARAIFEAVLDENSAAPSAHMGLGWTRLRMREYDDAINSLDRALSENQDQTDGNAGRAFAFFERSPQQFEEAAGAGKTALRLLNARWIFEHNRDVDWRDVRLVMARSYLELERYDDVTEQILLLGGPNIPSSEAFANEMRVEIDRLVGLYGGHSGGKHREFEHPPGSVAVRLRLIDVGQQLTASSGLAIKGQFDVDVDRRIVSEDPNWLAPWPLLFDDGPWTEGGHEPVGETAGDHVWSVTFFVAPGSAAQQFQYSVVTGAQINADGFTGGVAGVADSGETKIWPEVGDGFFAVAPGGGADIDLPLITLPASTASR